MQSRINERSEATTHPEAAEFYVATLRWLLAEEVLRLDMKLLVVCGAELDRDVLESLGFRTATISNLETHTDTNRYAPFAGDAQDVEALTLSDNEYDFCIAHNGLHHCLSPHRGLLEMFRVARLGVVVFEPRDTFVTRCGVKLHLGQEYETGAVAANGCVAGGVRNTAVPNYVYRWTEREIEKTILSFSPWGRPRFIYRYALRIPWLRLRMMNRRVFYGLVRTLRPLLDVFFRLFPKQANGFAFVALKPQLPEDLHPWMELSGGNVRLNEEWMADQYDLHKNDDE